MLLPVLVAIMVAKWVADSVTHSLYHAVLEVKCVPILYNEPKSVSSLDLVPVHAIMASPVVTLREHMKLDALKEVLRDTRHNGFPVVRQTPQGQVGTWSKLMQCLCIHASRCLPTTCDVHLLLCDVHLLLCVLVIMASCWQEFSYIQT